MNEVESYEYKLKALVEHNVRMIRNGGKVDCSDEDFKVSSGQLSRYLGREVTIELYRQISKQIYDKLTPMEDRIRTLLAKRKAACSQR